MRIGASQYHPGLTVRWNDIGDDWASMFAPQFGSVLLIQRFSRGWGLHSFIRGQARHDGAAYARRCDAKRAAEVLVGQWWREKCEREARAVRYTFRAEGVEKVTAAFRALADAAREGAERR